MKKGILVVLLAGLFACNDSATTTKAPDSSGTIRSAIENVNGNIPDTANTIELSTTDSTVRTDSGR